MTGAKKFRPRAWLWVLCALPLASLGAARAQEPPPLGLSPVAAAVEAQLRALDLDPRCVAESLSSARCEAVALSADARTQTPLLVHVDPAQITLSIPRWLLLAEHAAVNAMILAELLDRGRAAPRVRYLWDRASGEISLHATLYLEAGSTGARVAQRLVRLVRELLFEAQSQRGRLAAMIAQQDPDIED